MDFVNMANRISTGSADSGDIVDAITFIESKWGLDQKLYPVQRVIIKAHYGLALDDNPYNLDLSKKVPRGHPKYSEITAKTGAEKGYYIHRVKISDWRRKNFEVHSEASYLRKLYKEGRCNIKEVIPGKERREMVLAIGRRSGKTQIASFIAAYETYKLIRKGNPQAYYGLPIGEPIGMVSVATDKDQAAVLYGKVSGYYKKCPFFEPYTANNTMTYARFQTPEDIARYGQYANNEKANATLKVAFKPCRAKGLRGPGNILIILDELAHFNNAGQTDAKVVYDAVTPSISAFSPKDPEDPTTPWDPNNPHLPPEQVEVEGRIISISSPLGKQGLFYTLFQLAMGVGAAADNMIAIQAPTWEVNPTVPATEFEKNYLKDANSFFTEYGAQFSDRTRGWIEDSKDLLACVDPSHRPTQGISRRPHFVGLDFGLVGDGSSIAIGHLDENENVVVDLVDWIKAGEGEYEAVDRLDFDEVADWVLDYSKQFNFSIGVFDQWSGVVFEQALAKRGLRQLVSTHFTRQLSSLMFKNFKDMMYDERLVLYDWPLPESSSTEGDHCSYITELLNLQAEYVSKYITVVKAPQVAGKHDDQSDALIRMVWAASQGATKKAYVAGSSGNNKAEKRRTKPSAKESLARLNRAKRNGGSSPDRQRSSVIRGGVRGRRR